MKRRFSGIVLAGVTSVLLLVSGCSTDKSADTRDRAAPAAAGAQAAPPNTEKGKALPGAVAP